jgi:putative SOS response-associated peptidase YedK
MCNLYSEKVSYRQLFDEFSQQKLPILFPEPHAAPNLEPREEIRPTETAPVIRPRGEGVEFVSLKWGFAPGRPKGAPVINFRSEGRRFTRGRCLIPASHFFEFTGARYPKTRWKFTVPGREWFCLAGLWREAEGGWPPSFTMLTTRPGPDMQPYHDRQLVVIPPGGWRDWLDPEADPASMLEPGPAGSLLVEQAPRPGAAAPSLL